MRQCSVSGSGGPPILHDHPALSPREILGAEQSSSASGLDRHAERLKITPLSRSTREMLELWSVFATSYRASSAFDVSVVLIDSTGEKRTPQSKR